MDREVNNIMLFIATLIFMSACALFLQRSIDWWKHPDFGENIKTIAIYAGQFRMSETKPIITLNQSSADAEKIIEVLARASFYRNWAKFESFVNIDIIYEDGKVDHVLVGYDFIEFVAHGSDQSKYYKIDRKDTDTIRNIIEVHSRSREAKSDTQINRN